MSRLLAVIAVVLSVVALSCLAVSGWLPERLDDGLSSTGAACFIGAFASGVAAALLSDGGSDA